MPAQGSSMGAQSGQGGRKTSFIASGRALDCFLPPNVEAWASVISLLFHTDTSTSSYLGLPMGQALCYMF